MTPRALSGLWRLLERWPDASRALEFTASPRIGAWFEPRPGARPAGVAFDRIRSIFRVQLIDAEPILLNNNNQSKHHLRFAKHVEEARTRAQVLPGGGPSMLSTWEKFHSATIELAGSGPIKQRLLGAYVHHLASLTEEQVPKEIREDFCTFSREMRAVRPLPGEDPVRATVRKMSADDANRHAVQIVNMLGVVSRSQMTSRASDLAPVVQLYADLSAASRS